MQFYLACGRGFWPCLLGLSPSSSASSVFRVYGRCLWTRRHHPVSFFDGLLSAWLEFVLRWLSVCSAGSCVSASACVWDDLNVLETESHELGVRTENSTAMTDLCKGIHKKALTGDEASSGGLLIAQWIG